jgi:hypothetical protein
MPAEFELLSPTDKPALLAVGNADALATCKFVLNDLGYKIHVATNHEDFSTRFSQVQYQVVIIEELFATSVATENLTLQSVKAMPMSQRRHAVFFLLGDTFQSLNPMQAFQQSVHGVVNRSDLGRLSPILQQVISDTSLFLNVYRETQLRAAQGKV